VKIPNSDDWYYGTVNAITKDTGIIRHVHMIRNSCIYMCEVVGITEAVKLYHQVTKLPIVYDVEKM